MACHILHRVHPPESIGARSREPRELRDASHEPIPNIVFSQSCQIRLQSYCRDRQERVAHRSCNIGQARGSPALHRQSPWASKMLRVRLTNDGEGIASCLQAIWMPSHMQPGCSHCRRNFQGFVYESIVAYSAAASVVRSEVASKVRTIVRDFGTRVVSGFALASSRVR